MDQNNPESELDQKEITSDRSVSTTSVMDLLQDSIRADGCINGRSTFGRSLRAIKDMIRQDRFEAAETILINDIAMMAVLEKAIACQVLSNPEDIFQESGLNPLLGVSFLRFREAKHRALSLLLNLKKNGKRRDLGDITFD
jgi:hypothetical protein